MFHKTHSLESLKQIYRIKGEVNHNALSDAIDLYHIHEAYRMERALDEEEIGRLYRTMRQKQVEGMKKRRRHQLERLRVQMADLLEQKRWQAIRALKQWDGFHAELITFAQQVQLSSVRSLRERPRPIQVQACLLYTSCCKSTCLWKHRHFFCLLLAAVAYPAFWRIGFC